MKNILFINHSSSFGGAQRSLYEYMQKIDKKKFNLFILSPKQENDLLKNFNFIEFNYIPQLYNGVVGGYRGIRYLLLIRELIYFLLFFIFCFILKKKLKKIDLIHFNEITLLPCIILKLFFNCKVVSHLRQKQKINNSFLSNLFRNLSKKYLWKIVAIDSDVYDGSYNKKKTIICRNFLNIDKKTSINKRKDSFIVSYIGTLIESKGIINFIEIAKYFENKKEFAKINFYVFGKVKVNHFRFLLSKFFKNPYLSTSKIKVRNLMFFGEKNNLIEIYNSTDLILFCSNLDAIGRPVMEAAFMKKSSIVFLEKKITDYVIDGKTGFIVKNRNIKEAIKKIIYLYKNPKQKRKIDLEAHKFIKSRFGVNANFNKFEKNILNVI